MVNRPNEDALNTKERAKVFLHELANGRYDAARFSSLFHPNVTWNAIAGRAPERGVKLGSHSLTLYLTRIAQAIASKQFSLEILSINDLVSHMLVRTQWQLPNGGKRFEECANIVFIQDSQIVQVIEGVA